MSDHTVTDLDSINAEYDEILTLAQLQRCEALYVARAVLITTGPLGKQDVSSFDLVDIARFVLTGSTTPDPEPLPVSVPASALIDPWADHPDLIDPETDKGCDQ